MFCNISWKDLNELLASPVKLRIIRLLEVFIITRMDELTLWESLMNLQGTLHEKASFRAALTVWSRLLCGHACVSINTWKRWWNLGHHWHPLEPWWKGRGKWEWMGTVAFTLQCAGCCNKYLLNLILTRNLWVTYLNHPCFTSEETKAQRDEATWPSSTGGEVGACEAKAALLSEPKLGYNYHAGHHARRKTNKSACLCVYEHVFVYITRASKYWKKFFFFPLHSLSHCLQAFFFSGVFFITVWVGWVQENS